MLTRAGLCFSLPVSASSGCFSDDSSLYRFRQAIHAQGVGVSRVALIGNCDVRAEQFIGVLKARPNSGYELVGIVTETVGVDDSAVPSLGESQDILEIVQKYRLDTLFISSPTVPNETILQILHACEGVPVQINVLPELSEFIKGGTAITFFEGIPVLQLRETPMQGVSGHRQTSDRYWLSACLP